MQTLKTAAIVVLLMIVTYGVYVSLTAPQEPTASSEMLIVDEEATLAMDASLPDSLGALEISTGSPEGSAGPSMPGLAVPAMPIPTAVSATSPTPPPAPVNALDLPPTGGAADLAPRSVQDSGTSASMTDLAVSESGVTTTLTDLGATPPNAMDVAPRGDLNAQASANDPARNYPRTNSTFELPDPNSVQSSFDPNLALASGTSDAGSVPPDVSKISSQDPTGLPGGTDLGLTNAIQTADRLYREDKRKEALATLSVFYSMPNLSGEQRSDLLSRLDPLAREVIYSRRHLLELPHRVGQNETLMAIAGKYEVPWQLLANINQVKDPVTVLPGTELKVVRGPFRAEVDMSSKELTLFLGDLYAGRFPIEIGNDPTPKAGTFTVQDKQTSRTYYDAAGSPVPPGSPDNPYGQVWLDLGGQLCIHGSPSTTSPTNKGCISLAADYADDLYGILSQGSSVTIRR